MLRFALAPRWILRHLLVLAVLGTFLSLGTWQLRRLDERRAFNDRLTARTSMPVVDVRSLFDESPSPADSLGAAAYRRVTAEGTFDVAGEVVVRNRSRRSIAGHHLVTPLRLDDGTVLLVDRGWVEFRMDEPPVREAAPPEGPVRLTGVLFPAERRGRFGPRDPARGRLRTAARIDVPRLAQDVDAPVYPAWLLLERQEPAQRAAYPRSVPLPRLDEGPHRSYAIQWFLFAAVAVAGYGALLRRASRRDQDAPGVGSERPSSTSSSSTSVAPRSQ